MKKVLLSLLLLIISTQANPMLCGPVMDSMKKNSSNMLAPVDEVIATYEKEKEKYRYTNDNTKVRAAFDTFCQSKLMTYGTQALRKLNGNSDSGYGHAPVTHETQEAVNTAYKSLGIKPENQLPVYNLLSLGGDEAGMIVNSSSMYINETILDCPKSQPYHGMKQLVAHHEVGHVKYNDNFTKTAALYSCVIGLSVHGGITSKQMFSKRNLIKNAKLMARQIGVSYLFLFSFKFFNKFLYNYQERRADLTAVHAMQCGICTEKMGYVREGFSGKDYLNQEQLNHIGTKQNEVGKKCDYHKTSVLKYDKK